jgi:nicotinamidase-related amidase
VNIAAGAIAPVALAGWIDPAHTAVVVVDMQVDFASPEGALGRSGIDMAIVQPALAAAERLVAAARIAGAPVIFVGLQTTAETNSRAWLTRMRRRGDIEIALCPAGERGAAFVGPTPRPNELVIAKTRYSAFFDTPLDEALQARGVDTVIVCGLTTECCVDCTVTHAFQLDYQVFVVSDACAAYERGLHEAALKSMDLNCAILVTTREVETAWRESALHG